MIRRAFTLIELLVTIGILVILAAMVLIATRSITGTAKSHATRIALDNAKAMLGEYDATKKLSEDSSECWVSWHSGSPILWDPSSSGPTNPTTSNPVLNFWLLPDGTVSGSTIIPFPIDSPGYIRNDALGGGARNASHAVVNTMVAMGRLAAIPANREALLKLPADQSFMPDWQGGQIQSPGADGVPGTQDDGPYTALTAAQYPAGCRMRDTTDGNVYVCTKNNTASGNPKSDTGNWRRDVTPIPALKDGWGNPIIFVPASGMKVRLLNGYKNYLDDSKDPDYSNKDKQIFVVVSPEGQVSGNGTAAPIVLRAGRPFFASAGPDGDFSKGDDNIYSFEP